MVIKSTIEKGSLLTPVPQISNWSANVIWTNLVPNTRYGVSNIAGFDRYDALNPQNTLYNPYIFRTPVIYNHGSIFSTGSDDVRLRISKDSTKFKIYDGLNAKMAMILPGSKAEIVFTTNQVRDKEYRLDVHVGGTSNEMIIDDVESYNMTSLVMNEVVYDTGTEKFDTSSLENVVINTNQNYFSNFTVWFSYYNTTDNVDVLANVDADVVKKTNPFDSVSNSITKASTRLRLPTSMVTDSISHDRVTLKLEPPDFDSNVLYWDDIFTDKANVETSNVYESNISMTTGDLKIYKNQNFRDISAFETNKFVYSNLLPSNEYVFRIEEFKNYTNLIDKSEVLKFDSTRRATETLTQYVQSDYTHSATTASDNVSFTITDAARELLNDNGDTRLFLSNIAFHSESANLVYDAIVEISTPSENASERPTATKEGLTSNTDFITLTFESDEFYPPLFHFGTGNVHVSFRYANVNWENNGYVTPISLNDQVLDVNGNILITEAFELPTEADISTIDVSLTEFINAAADRVQVKVANISTDFVSFPNLTNRYKLEANIINSNHHYLVDIPIEAGNISNDIIYELNNLLPNSQYTTNFLSFTHLDAQGNASNVNAFFEPFTSVTVGPFRTASDDVSVSFDTITPIVLDNNGSAGFVFDNFVFNSNASTQDYQINISLQEILNGGYLSDTILTANVSMDYSANIIIQPTGLSFGEYLLTNTYTNTTYNVPVTDADGANVSETFFETSYHYHLRPLPLPTIGMRNDDTNSNSNPNPNKIYLDFEYTHPFDGMANSYTMGFDRTDSFASGGFNHNTFETKVFVGLVPNKLYGVEMKSFTHNNDANSQIQFDTSNYPSANVHTASDNVSFVYDTSNVHTALTDDDGNMSVTLFKDPGFAKFFQRVGGNAYTISANITTSSGSIESYDIANIHNFIDPQLVLSEDINFNYFENYTLTFSYKNTTYNSYALDGPSGNVITDTIDIGTRSPLNVPGFGLDSWGSTSIKCKFESYDPNVLVINNEYRYVVKAVASDHSANILSGILGKEAFNRREFTFGNLYPSRTYTISYELFEHLKSDGNVSGIIIADYSEEPNITTATALDDFQLTNANVEFVLLNNQKHTQITIKDVVVSNAMTGIDYIARITVNGNPEDFDNVENTYSFSNVEFDYFANIDVVLSFYYKNNTADIPVLDSNGNPVSKTFGTHVERALAPSRLISSNIGVTSADLQFEDFTHFSIFSTYTWTLRYTNADEANVDVEFSNSDSWDTVYQFANLAPNKNYALKLVAFGSPEDPDGNITFGNLLANVDILTLSDNVSSSVDIANVSRDLVNDNGDIGNITLPSFVFNTEAVTNDYIVTVTFNEDNNYVCNHEFFIDKPFGLSYDLVINTPLLDYFTDYTVELTFLNNTHGNIEVVDDGEGNIVVNSFQLEGVPPLQSPTGISASNISSESIPVKLTGFTKHPNISNSFTGSFRVINTEDNTGTDYPFDNKGWESEFILSNLESSTSYNIYLSSWAHGGGNISFDTPTANIETATADPTYLSIPTYRVTDVGYTSIAVQFDTYAPYTNLVNISDSYDLQIKVSDENQKSYDNISASNIGNIDVVFTDLLPGNDYTVSLFAFSNDGRADAVDPSTLPSNVECQTLAFVEPTVSLSSVQTTLVNDRGHLSVALDAFSYASEFDYAVRFVFGNATTESNITMHRGTSFESFERLEFAPESFAVPLDVHKTYTLSIRYLHEQQEIVDSSGNVIEFMLDGDAVTARTFNAPETITVTEANVESVTLSLIENFIKIDELSDLYRANISVTSEDANVEYKPFVADSANLTIQIDRLVPNRSYEFGLVEFNHMRDESNVSDIVFSNIDANVQKNTLTDNVSISYDNIETDLLDSSGSVAYVRFTNFTFSTDAPNKKYDMTISFVNNESDTTIDLFSFTQDNIDEHLDGMDFSITSLREDVLYFENIDVSFTFLNSTDQVDVDSVFDDTIIGADPFSVPTEIKLAGNTGDTLAVYLDGFNSPHSNLTENYYANVTLFDLEGNLVNSFAGVDTWSNISNSTSGWAGFSNLASDSVYTVKLIEFRHESDNIIFDTPEANSVFYTASDNISVSFDIANVSRRMSNANADIDRLTLPNFEFRTDTPSKTYNMSLVLTDTSNISQTQTVWVSNIQQSAGNLDIPVDPSIVLNYFESYSFEIGIENQTDGIITENVSNGTFTGMPYLPLPEITVTANNIDNLNIKVQYENYQINSLENVFQPLIDNDALYTGNVEIKRHPDSSYSYYNLGSNIKYSDYLKPGANRRFAISELRPSTNYQLKLVDFKYLLSSGTESAIRFVTNNVQVGGNTNDDDSSITSLTSTRTMSNVDSTDMKLTGIVFNAHTISTNYDLELNFYANMDGSRDHHLAYGNTVSSFYNHVNQEHNSNIEINNTSLNYHQNYDLVVTYKGSTGYEHRGETVFLQGADPWVLRSDPALISVGSTLTTIKFVLGNVEEDDIENIGGKIPNRLTNNSFTANFEYYNSENIIHTVSFENLYLSQLLPSAKVFTIDANLSPDNEYTIDFIGVTYISDRLRINIPIPYPTANIFTAADDVDISFESVSRELYDGTGASKVTFNDFTFTGQEGYDYDLTIQFTEYDTSSTVITKTINNIHDTGIVPFSEEQLNYFVSYTIGFTYVNKTTDIDSESPLVGVLERTDYLPVPVEFIEVTATAGTITANLGFTDIEVIYNPLTPDNYSFDIVAIPEIGDSFELSVENKTSNHIRTQLHTINGVEPDTTYTVSIINFKHNNTDSLLFDVGTVPTGNVTTLQGISVSASYSNIITSYYDNDPYGLVANITFENFNFIRSGTNVDYQLEATFAGNVVYNEIRTLTYDQVTTVVGIPGGLVNSVLHPFGSLTIPRNVFVESGRFLDYFKEYTVQFNYINANTDETDGAPDSMQNNVPAGVPITPPAFDNSNTTSEQISVFLDMTHTTGTIPVGLEDHFYANLSYSRVDEDESNFSYDNMYQTKNGNLSSLTEWTFNGLLANTDYQIQLIDFAHYHNGNKNDAIPVGALPGSLSVHTTSANVGSTFDEANVSTTLLNENGYIGNVVLPGFGFQSNDSRYYNLMVTFTGDNISNVDGHTLTLDSLTTHIDNIGNHINGEDLTIMQETYEQYFLDYFTSYNITFEYFNVTDNTEYESNVTGIIPAGVPITPPVPVFISNSNTTSEQISIFLDMTVTTVTIPVGLEDHFYANLSYSRVDEDNLSYDNMYQTKNGNLSSLTEWTFNGLLANTDYQIQLIDFAHYHNGNTNAAIRIGAFPVPLIVHTTSANVGSTFDEANVSTTLLNENGYIGNVVLPGFSFQSNDSRYYNLMVTFTGDNISNVDDHALTLDSLTTQIDNIGNHSDGDDLTISANAYNDVGYLDYFTNYGITLKYFNVTDNTDATEYTQDFTTGIIPAGASLTVPLTFSDVTQDAGKLILEKFNFVLPAELSGILDSDSTYSANIAAVPTEEDGVEREDGIAALRPYTNKTQVYFEGLSNIEFTGLVSGTYYKLQIRSFEYDLSSNLVWDLGNLSESDPIQIGSINIQVVSTSRTILDNANIGILTFTDLSVIGTINSLDLYVYFDPPNESLDPLIINGVVPDSSNTHNLDVSAYNLNYFTEYSVYFKIKFQNQEEFVKDSNGDDKVINKTSNAGDPFSKPNISGSHITSERATVDLIDFTHNANLTDSYNANVSYYKVSDAIPIPTMYTGLQTWTSSSSFATISGLVPNETYKLTLVEFKHNNQDLIQFADVNNITAEFTTALDNVAFSNVTSTITNLLDQRGLVSELTMIPTPFVFTHDGTKDYALNIEFTQEGSAESANVWDATNDALTTRKATVVVSNINTRESGPLTITHDDFNNAGYFLDYFQTYNITMTVTNTTDNVEVDSNTGNLISLTFGNVVAANVGITYPFINDSNIQTADSITITLGDYPALEPNVSNNYYANVGYMPTGASIWVFANQPRIDNVSSMTFDSLVPNTIYRFILYEFGANHEDQRLLFAPGPGQPTEVTKYTANDGISLSSSSLTRTVKSNAQTDTITLQNFTFTLQNYSSVSKNYAANITITETGNPDGTALTFNKSNIINLNGNYQINNEILNTFGLNFFTTYTLRFEYFNVKDGVPVYNNINDQTRLYKEFTLTAESNLVCPIGFGTFTRTATSIVLSNLTFNADSRLVANISHKYDFKLIIITTTEVVGNNYNDTNVSNTDIEATSNITFLELEPATDYTITLTDFVHKDTSNLQYDNFPTQSELTTGKFTAPTISDPESRTSSSVDVQFRRANVDELPDYLARKTELNNDFKATFSVVASPQDNQTITSNLSYNLDPDNVVLTGLLPNTNYTITLTGFEHNSGATIIPFNGIPDNAVTSFYTSTDNVSLSYNVVRNLVDDDGGCTLTFANVTSAYNTGYIYKAEIRTDTNILIHTIANIATSDTASNFDTDQLPLPYIYYDTQIPINIKFKNTSFTTQPYVKIDDRTTDKVQFDNISNIAYPTITLNINEVTTSNASLPIIQLKFAENGHTLLADVGTFKPFNLYRLNYTISEDSP